MPEVRHNEPQGQEMPGHEEIIKAAVLHAHEKNEQWHTYLCW